jgi:hypothetical protein
MMIQSPPLVERLSHVLRGTSPSDALRALVATGLRTYADAIASPPAPAMVGEPVAQAAGTSLGTASASGVPGKKPCCNNCAEGKNCDGSTKDPHDHHHDHAHEHAAAPSNVVDVKFREQPAAPVGNVDAEAEFRMGFLREVLRGTVVLDTHVTFLCADGSIGGLVRREKLAEFGFRQAAAAE